MGRLFLRWLSTRLDHITITGPLSKGTESQGSPEWMCSVDMGLRTTRNWQSLPQARLRHGKAFLSTTVADASTILEITPPLHQRAHLHSSEITLPLYQRAHLHSTREHTSLHQGTQSPLAPKLSCVQMSVLSSCPSSSQSAFQDQALLDTTNPSIPLWDRHFLSNANRKRRREEEKEESGGGNKTRPTISK